MPDGLTKQQLLPAAARAGLKVSADQLKRWCREGLLPRPSQRHLPGRRGSESIYPPGTLRQLVAVAELHANERRFDELRFDVWWAGHWVQETHLRSSLVALLEDPLEEIREVRRMYSDPVEAANQLFERATPAAGRSPVTRLLRRRVGGREDDLISAMHPLLVLALGGDPIWDVPDVAVDVPEPSPLALFARAVGFDRASSDRLDTGEPWLATPPDLVDHLTTLRDAGAFELEHPGQIIEAATWASLELARQHARFFTEQLSAVAAAVEYRFGRDAAGLGLFSAMRRSDLRWFRALFVRLWVIAPTLPSLDADSPLREVEAAVEDQLPQIEAALELANAFPGYKPFFKPGGERLLSELPLEEREVIQKTLTTYIAQHPHLQDALPVEEK